MRSMTPPSVRPGEYITEDTGTMSQDEGEAKEESAVRSMKSDDSQEETMGYEEPCHPVEADDNADHEEANGEADDEEDHGQPMGLRDPGQPSNAERAEHCLAHIP